MNIEFQPTEDKELGLFLEETKAVFSIAIIEQFGKPENGEVVFGDEIDHILHNPKTVAYFIYLDGKKIGGVALGIDNETHHNSLDLLYIYPDCHGKGLGFRIWKMIEEMYPQTEVWEVATPYFEKRNISFYVNKCGFHIVEFFNKYHEAPDSREGQAEHEKEFFRFEKRMNPCRISMPDDISTSSGKN